MLLIILIIIEVFLFLLSFTYCENGEIKVTVKLTGSTLVHGLLTAGTESRFSEIIEFC